jgi:3-hydroxyisobutyrate dehydrogenase
MKVAFIGVGNMGAPMAANIAKAGHEVFVHDSDVTKASRLAPQIGAKALGRMSEIASVEIVVTMLPDGKVVRSVALDDDGIATYARPGTVVIDMSSSQPLITRETGTALAAKGITLIDAPVSGGVERAAKATLTIMIGGDDPAAIEKAKGVLSCMGNTFFEVGALGSGHVAKSLNNVVAAANFGVLAEAMRVAERYGINPETLVNLISTSTGQSFMSNIAMKHAVLPKTYNSGFKVGLLAKDVSIAAELSNDLGCATPFMHLAQERWNSARDLLGPDEDNTKAYLAWWAKK